MDQDNQYWENRVGFHVGRKLIGTVDTTGGTVHTIILGNKRVLGYAYWTVPNCPGIGRILYALHDGATPIGRPFSVDGPDCHLYLSGHLPCHGDIYVPGIPTGQEKRLSVV